MKRNNIILAGGILLLVLLVLVAFKSTQSRTVAKVNGYSISESELNERLMKKAGSTQ